MVDEMAPPRVEDATGKLAPEEFFVDFLGGLIPGTMFLFQSVMALFPPLFAFVTATGSGESPSLAEFLGDAIAAARDTPSFIWVAIAGAVITFAYLVGHLFYRQDPKEPDRRSFQKLAKKYTEQECCNELACRSVEECEFPYPHYWNYLNQRGLSHLKPFVRWLPDDVAERSDGSATDDPATDDSSRVSATSAARSRASSDEKPERSAEFRSKTYINLLKIRLRHYYPRKCMAIIRNEAHVRLASSAWYVSRVMRAIGVLATICIAAILLKSNFMVDLTIFLAILLSGAVFILLYLISGRTRRHPFQVAALAIILGSFVIGLGRELGASGVLPTFETLMRFVADNLPAIAFPALAIGLSEYTRSRVESFLHYQRLREVFFVLETAFTAFRGHYHLLEPPFPADELAAKAENQMPTTDSSG